MINLINSAVIAASSVWVYETNPWISGYAAGCAFCIALHAIGTYLAKRRERNG